jgi:hypothetical protein
MLARNIRIEEDLVDQLFNSSEKRLARRRCAGAAGKHDRPVAPSRRSPGNAGGNDRHDPLRVNFF